MAGIEIRRTLVIGMGSTGKEVLEKLAEYLSWQFGDFRRVPWVRLIALDTAQGGSILQDRLIWSGMTAAEFEPYKTNPNQAGYGFSFASWQEPATIGKLIDATAGAGNCRMMGRLCLLHPRTYDALQKRVKRDISDLDSLTPKSISESLNDTTLGVNIFHEITAYVVGTLCGGTCSGAAADIGYLLEAWNPGKLRRQAIFTIPHPGSSALPRHKKNAYYALKELNHYFLYPDNPWEQKLPENPDVIRVVKEPYEFCYIMKPAGTDKKDIIKLNGMIAQYFAAACGKAGYQVAESDSDGYSFMTKDHRVGFMRPRFSTFGVAALEFPGEHIQWAATNLLISSTLQQWLNNSFDIINDLSKLTRVRNFDDLVKKIIDSAEQAILADIRSLSGQQPSEELLNKTIDSTENMLKGIDLSNSDGQANLAVIMQRNKDTIISEIEQEIQSFVDKYLCDIEGGPAFVSKLLRKRMLEMEEWAKEIESRDPIISRDVNALYDIMRSKLGEFKHAINNRNPLGKRAKIANAWNGATNASTEYLEKELQLYCLKHISRQKILNMIMDAYRNQTSVLLKRLDHLESAFLREAEDREKSYKEQNTSLPEINGKVYFEKESTVEKWFDRLISKKLSASASANITEIRYQARKSLLDDLTTKLLPEIKKEPGKSIFDDRSLMKDIKEFLGDIPSSLETKAREFFSDLPQEEHILHLSPSTDISSLISESKPWLRISPNMIPEKLKNERECEIHTDDLAMTATKRIPQETLKQVSETIEFNLKLHAKHIVDSDDPYRLLIIRQVHGFTLAQMEGVTQRDANDQHALQYYEHCRDFPFWHTRRDITWVDPIIPSDIVERLQEEWLLTILLGRWDDERLSFTPAAHKEIPPKGWYDVKNGNIHLYPLPGEPNPKIVELPLDFSEAVIKLIMDDDVKVYRRLNTLITGYLDQYKYDRFVECVEIALKSLPVYTVNGIDSNMANMLKKRYYSRKEELASSYFNYLTKTETDTSSFFSMLWHDKGEEIAGHPGKLYPEDGYYCPNNGCNYPLGVTPEDLHKEKFQCPVCQGERYWP